MVGGGVRTIAFLVFVLTVSGCAAKPQAIFPDAVAVRAYAAGGPVHVGNDGTVTAFKPSPDGKSAVTVPPAGGDYLTAEEIASLRSAISFSKPPEMSTACCIPRHAFVFYDRDNRYLGYLLVCFQCGCAEMKPMPATDPDQSYINWDQARVHQILEAHRLPIRRE